MTKKEEQVQIRALFPKSLIKKLDVETIRLRYYNRSRMLRMIVWKYFDDLEKEEKK